MSDIAHHIELEPAAAPRRAILLIPLLAIWAAIVGALAYSGTFNLPPNEPALPTLIAIALPVALFALVTAASRPFRAWLFSLDPVLLTEFQAWRIVGGAFLIVYAFGHLPGLFAWPAGLGDVAVGVAAPFIVWRLRRDRAFLGTTRFRLFHYAGLFDFAVAVTTGIASRNAIPGLVEGVNSSPMGQLPLVMIPTLVVPAFIILHLIVLMQSFHAAR